MRNEQPLVSVCVVTYNHIDYIKECLDGILMQKTSFKFELIIGEDESDDGTREVCEEYALRYPEKIRLFLRKRKDVIYINGKPSGRFNFIQNLKEAKGKYIALCDGDDFWTSPFKLQKQIDFLESNLEYSLIFHNVNQIITRNGLYDLNPVYTNRIKKEYNTIDLISPWFIETCSVVFRNYKDFNLPVWFTHCASADIPLILLLSLRGNLYYLNENLGSYRLHNSGISYSHRGYYKSISMVYIYQCFNAHTEFKFNDNIELFLKDEIKRHLPEIIELNSLRIQNLELKKKLKNPGKLLKEIIKNRLNR